MGWLPHLECSYHSSFKSFISQGVWVAQLVKHLPSAQVIIPGSQAQAPPRAPCSAGSCFSLSLSLCLPLGLLVPLSLCLSCK